MSVSIETQRGREKLSHGGYLYVFAGFSKDQSKEFWRCQFKASKAKKCNARIHKVISSGVISSGVISVLGVHSDMPDPAGVEANHQKTALKRRAGDTLETPVQIISKVRIASSQAAQGRLESNKSLARIVQRVRSRLGIPSMHNMNLADVEIPEELCRIELSPGNYERFLLKDSNLEGSDNDDDDDEGDAKRILIFGRASVSTWIKDISKIYVDGTFSLAPEHFSQIFVILGEQPGGVVPICFVLMPDKSQNSYSKVGGFMPSFSIYTQSSSC